MVIPCYEFSTLQIDRVTTRVDVEFYERAAKLKQHSTMSKRARVAKGLDMRTSNNRKAVELSEDV